MSAKATSFLFFGRFVEAERTAEGVRFVRGARPFHAVWGYLEVGEEVRLEAASPAERAAAAPRWAADFPHFFPRMPPPRTETVYVAAPTMRDEPSIPGFGVFRYRDDLRLTREGSTGVSTWQLPRCFDGVPLTYNRPTDDRPWTAVGEQVHVTAASIGQEFVAEATDELRDWARGIIAGSTTWQAADPLS